LTKKSTSAGQQRVQRPVHLTVHEAVQQLVKKQAREPTQKPTQEPTRKPAQRRPPTRAARPLAKSQRGPAQAPVLTRSNPSAQASALDANALELFARVVAAGSFAQAARELGLTRAAISRRVASIEALTGKPLFVRSTRALGLTESGRRLASRAKAVLEAAETARRALRKDARQGLEGTLRITSVTSFAQALLAPLLVRFQALHPALRMELRLTNRRMDLLRDDVDVAFRLTIRPPQDWVAQPVLRLTIKAYAAPRAGLPLADPGALAQQRCLVFGPPSETLHMRWQHEAGRSQEVSIEPVLIADDMGTLLAMACVPTCRDIVFLPDYAAAADVQAGRLLDVLPGWHLPVPEGQLVQALTLPQPDAPEAARLLVRFVKEALMA
jgi:DNA-binding transcriptional LysR family regulator